MSGDEVLQHVQPLTEVGGNRCLDNRAIRLGHQTAHTRKLTNLCRRATGTGVGHHEDGVGGFLHHILTFAILDRLFTQFVHHGGRHFIIGPRPDVDHLVVALTVGYQTRGILLFDVFDLGFGLGKDPYFLLGHHHVFHANGDGRPGRHAKAQIHDLVGKNDRRLQTKAAIALIDQH